MTNILGRLMLAALLIAGAVLCWGESQRLEAVAGVWQQLVLLQNDVAAPDEASRPLSLARWLPAALRPVADTGAQQKATGDYWLGRYDDLVRTRGGDPDPAVRLAAANAAYRVARRVGEPGMAMAEQLDAVREAYGEVLTLDPANVDAAWNYEFVARTRDVVARARVVGRSRPSADTPGLARPRGAVTVHGAASAAPPDVKAEEFETIAPMDFGDREAQPEATPGSTIKRKG